MKTVIIPSNTYPWWECTINGVKYRYKSGTEQTVPDEVAEIIENGALLEPRTVLPGKPGQVWTLGANGAGRWDDLPGGSDGVWEDLTEDFGFSDMTAATFTFTPEAEYDEYHIIIAARVGTQTYTFESKIGGTVLGKVTDISSSNAQLITVNVKHVGRWIYDLHTAQNKAYESFDPRSAKINVPINANHYYVRLTGNPSASTDLDETLLISFNAALPEGSVAIAYGHKVS